MTDDWETCVWQEISYRIGWMDRLSGVPKHISAMANRSGSQLHIRLGWNDADRRLRCPAMYAAPRERGMVPEENSGQGSSFPS